MAESLSFKDLPAKWQREIAAVKRPIMDLAAKFGVVREKIADLAPKVMKLYGQINASEIGPVSFIDFVRMVDPGVPTHAADKDGEAGYRKHKTYYTLDYMRRLVNLRPRGQRGVRDLATDGLARMIATILQVVKDPAPVWAAVQTEFRMGERMMTGLRRRVSETKPLLDLSDVAKPFSVESAKVIHMESARDRKAEEQTAAGQTDELRRVAKHVGRKRADLSRPGRRVHVAA